jgi:hypothetical protein
MNVFRKPGWAILVSLLTATTLSAANPYRILVIGDSISVGYTDNPNWTVPFEFGYRSGLYTRLTNSGLVGGCSKTFRPGCPNRRGLYRRATEWPRH